MPHTEGPQRLSFERFWLETRGQKRAWRELLRHPKQPQTYVSDSANRHYVTWCAARAAADGDKTPTAQPAPNNSGWCPGCTPDTCSGCWAGAEAKGALP